MIYRPDKTSFFSAEAAQFMFHVPNHGVNSDVGNNIVDRGWKKVIQQH